MEEEASGAAEAASAVAEAASAAAGADLAAEAHQEDGDMTFLKDGAKSRISDAIKNAEAQTSGELVTVIARSSDDYAFIPLLWSSMLALLTPIVLLVFDFGLSTQMIFTVQLAVFLILSLLFRFTPLGQRLVPKSVKRMRAARLAREQFLAQRLHHTAERTGVLIFVSVAEHYVEILADQGINDRVEQSEWDSIVAAFVDNVKRRRIEQGFVAAIEACGTLLAQHFPKTPGNPDELPNHLVEI
jgi:putative membrane protein